MITQFWTPKGSLLKSFGQVGHHQLEDVLTKLPWIRSFGWGLNWKLKNPGLDHDENDESEDTHPKRLLLPRDLPFLGWLVVEMVGSLLHGHESEQIRYPVAQNEGRKHELGPKIPHPKGHEVG